MSIYIERRYFLHTESCHTENFIIIGSNRGCHNVLPGLLVMTKLATPDFHPWGGAAVSQENWQVYHPDPVAHLPDVGCN